jgi:hypothetical protein
LNFLISFTSCSHDSSLLFLFERACLPV